MVGTLNTKIILVIPIGHSQILSAAKKNLHTCDIKSGGGLEMRLGVLTPMCIRMWYNMKALL